MKLSINGRSFSYEDKIIFDGLSLNLSSEKISVLIGQNGVGKSTLLRIIAGLEEQDKGEITLSNNSNDQILIRGNISYLGHKLELKENLSVHENINFWEKIPAYMSYLDLYVYYILEFFPSYTIIWTNILLDF